MVPAHVASTSADRSDPLITALAFDSRPSNQAACSSACAAGTATGTIRAAAAVAAGAVALVVDHDLDRAVPNLGLMVPQWSWPTPARRWHACDRGLRQPECEALDIVGITGTNGKTTTAHIVRSRARQLGRKTGLIGTLSGVHTTPRHPTCSAARRVRRRRCDAVAMEVSSHALVLDRVLGTRFRVGVFTDST